MKEKFLFDNSLIIRVPEAAALLGVSVSTVWAWGSPTSGRRLEGFPIIFRIGRGASGMFRAELVAFLQLQHDKKLLENNSTI